MNGPYLLLITSTLSIPRSALCADLGMDKVEVRSCVHFSMTISLPSADVECRMRRTGRYDPGAVPMLSSAQEEKYDNKSPPRRRSPRPYNTFKEILCPSPRGRKSLNYSLPGAPEISPLWKNWLRSFTRSCIAWPRPI